MTMARAQYTERKLPENDKVYIKRREILLNYFLNRIFK